MTRPTYPTSALTTLMLTLIGCTQPLGNAIAVSCTEITPQAAGPAQPPPGGEPGERGLAPALTVGPEDILELVVVLDSVPAGPARGTEREEPSS